MKKAAKILFSSIIMLFCMFSVESAQSKTPFYFSKTPKEISKTAFWFYETASDSSAKGIITECTLNAKSSCCELSFSYPELRGKNLTWVNREIKSLVEKLALELCNEQWCEEIKEMQASFVPFGGSRYDVALINEQLVSFVFEFSSYQGGAHPMTWRKGYTISLNSGKQLGLENIFRKGYDYKTPINSHINAEMTRQKDCFFEGSFTSVDEKTSFVVSDSSLIVFFPLYEIAPYSSGFPTFEIPLTEFGENCIFQSNNQSKQ